MSEDLEAPFRDYVIIFPAIWPTTSFLSV